MTFHHVPSYPLNCTYGTLGIIRYEKCGENRIDRVTTIKLSIPQLEYIKRREREKPSYQNYYSSVFLAGKLLSDSSTLPRRN